MTPADINPVQAAELIRRSLMLADRAVVADVEELCPAMYIAGVTWIDVRPLLDERELSMECIDLNREALDYALMRGLIARHPDHVHLVRVARHP
jgi:hypothetical protein